MRDCIPILSKWFVTANIADICEEVNEDNCAEIFDEVSEIYSKWRKLEDERVIKLDDMGILQCDVRLFLLQLTDRFANILLQRARDFDDRYRLF